MLMLLFVLGLCECLCSYLYWVCVNAYVVILYWVCVNAYVVICFGYV